MGSPIKNGQGLIREGSGVGFRVRLSGLVSRVCMAGLVSRVGFDGLSMFKLWPCPFFIGDPGSVSPSIRE